METNDLKNIWKSGVDKNIKPYSDKELGTIVVNTARKSMKRIYPSGILLLVIVAVIILLIVNITVRNTTSQMRMLDLGALMILTVSFTLLWVSFSKMRSYKADMPIKNWLEYRIKEVEKSEKFNTKYNLVIYSISLFTGLGFYYLYVWFSNITFNIWVVCAVTGGFVIYILLVRRSTNRNYKKTLNELQALYNELE